MSIEKILEGRSNGSEKEKLKKLARETGTEEFELDSINWFTKRI